MRKLIFITAVLFIAVIIGMMSCESMDNETYGVRNDLWDDITDVTITSLDLKGNKQTVAHFDTVYSGTDAGWFPGSAGLDIEITFVCEGVQCRKLKTLTTYSTNIHLSSSVEFDKEIDITKRRFKEGKNGVADRYFYYYEEDGKERFFEIYLDGKPDRDPQPRIKEIAGEKSILHRNSNRYKVSVGKDDEFEKTME